MFLDSKDGKFYFNISAASIIKLALAVLLFWFLYLIKDVLAIVFVSLVFAALIDPFASWFARHHVPKAVAVIVIYVIFFGLFAVGTILIIPPLIAESKELGENFGSILAKLNHWFPKLQFSSSDGFFGNLGNIISAFSGSLSSAWLGLFNTVSNFLGGLVAFAMVIVLTFYLVVEENALKQMAKFILPAKYHSETALVLVKVQKRVGGWVKGQLALGGLVGLMTYIGLLIIDVKYALVLALIAGLTELIPYIGPVFGAIPAVFLAFSDSPVKGLIVLALYFGVQQFEKLFLVPKVMQKTLGLNPVVSIVALVAGFKIGGVLGVLLSLPLVAALDVVLHEYVERKNR